MRYLFLIGALGWALAGAARGEIRITVDQAVREAVTHNLDLLVLKYDVALAEARLLTARTRPNPSFAASADHLDWLGTGFDGVNTAGPPEYAVRVDFPMLQGKRGLRSAVARAACDVARLSYENAERQLVYDVRSACVDVQAAEASRDLHHDSAEFMARVVKAAEGRVKSGQVEEVDLARSRVALLTVQNAELDTADRLVIAEERLLLLMGRTPGTVSLDLQDELRRVARVPTRDEVLREAYRERPDLEAARAELARGQAALALQEASAKPSFAVGTEARRQQGLAGRGSGAGFFFSIPLTVADRNQGEIAHARQEEAQARLKVKAVENSIALEAARAFKLLGLARRGVEIIESSMLGAARDVREIMERSYARGEASLVELLDAVRSYNDTMQSYNEARTDLTRVLHRIEAIAGRGAPGASR